LKMGDARRKVINDLIVRESKGEVVEFVIGGDLRCTSCHEGETCADVLIEVLVGLFVHHCKFQELIFVEIVDVLQKNMKQLSPLII
jgi:hypothetical protein